MLETIVGTACALLPPTHVSEMEARFASTTDRDTVAPSLLAHTFALLSESSAQEKILAHAAAHTDDDDVSSEEWKERGNAHFQVEAFDNAIASFTNGLRGLVVDSPATALLQAVLFTNRCAAWQAKKQWRFAFEDATRAIAACPTYAKGWFRRGKILEACLVDDADIAQTLYLEMPGEDPRGDISTTIARDLRVVQGLVDGTMPPPPPLPTPTRHASTRPTVDFSHPHVVVQTTTTMGRSLQATDAIAAGTVLLTETPLAHAVDPATQYCAHCAKRTPNPVPCDHCAHDMYCGAACRAAAWDDHHRHECGLQLPVHEALGRVYFRLLNLERFPPPLTRNADDADAGDGVVRAWDERGDAVVLNALLHSPPIRLWLPPHVTDARSLVASQCTLALCDDASMPRGLVRLQPWPNNRVDVWCFFLPSVPPPSIAQQTAWLHALRQRLHPRHHVVVLHTNMDATAAASRAAGFAPRGDHEFVATDGDDASLTISAALQSQANALSPHALARVVVAAAAYAVADPWRPFLHDDATTLPRLFLAMCQLPTNVLAITTTTVDDGSVDAKSRATDDVVQRRVGVGVYPATAMINHSCVPNSFVRFDGATLSVVASRMLAPGDDVLISYGPHAAKMDAATRQAILRDQYLFACACAACRHVDGPASSPSLSTTQFLKRTRLAEAHILDRLTSSHKLHEVQALAEALLADRLHTLDADDVLVGRAFDLLAQLAAVQGQFWQAYQHCARSIAVLETKYAPVDAELGHEYFKAAQLLWNADRHDLVAPMLAKARASLVLHLPPDDPTLVDMDALGAMLHAPP
ncbi:Aste57867_21579 [Aphanomyces stellatus]|uniref:Aste57867_21579 protein n=1 Tax=Aphanomyces stellatus TaxID=120398 RepID=A0A485LII9_9STRA|nr:hypothetical protein As57867_021510 [Aphanomyces stellatus]VFT98249.1 Aste57867_21579 [Aphanomyces stellatus]